MDEIQYQRDTVKLLANLIPLLVQMEMQSGAAMQGVVRGQLTQVGRWLEEHAGLPQSDFVEFCVLNREYLSGEITAQEMDRRIELFKGARTRPHIMALALGGPSTSKSHAH